MSSGLRCVVIAEDVVGKNKKLATRHSVTVDCIDLIGTIQ